MRFFVFHFIEFFITWAALFLLNETDEPDKPQWWKIAGILLCSYVSTFITNLMPRMEGDTVGQYGRIVTMLVYLLCCCVLFTGGVPKLMLSIIIADVWMGGCEILMVIIFCIICRKNLDYIYLYQYDERMLLQWAVEIAVGVLMLHLSKTLFDKYKRVAVADGKQYVFFCCICIFAATAFQIKPLGLMREEGFPYYYTLIYFMSFCVILAILLSRNRKRVLEAEISELYLKQKMEQEYTLLFADMDREMRCFRHDVKKHMDALSYLAENGEIDVSKELIKKYREDLKDIYVKLTYGNYCSKFDVNLILTQMADECRDRKTEFSVMLRNLNLDSLPVNIRVQMFEMLKEWFHKQSFDGRSSRDSGSDVHSGRAVLTLNGMTVAGFHTLTVSLERDSCFSREHIHMCDKIWERIRKSIFSWEITVRIRKLLNGHQPTVKIKNGNGVNSLVICWHGGAAE